MARIPYLDPEEMSAEDRESLESYQDSDVDLTPHVREPSEEYMAFREEKSSNLYGLLGYNPKILNKFREFASALREECGLEPAKRELVILTVARVLDAEYVWNHHVRIAFEFDIPKDDIVKVSNGDFDEFDESVAAVLRYARDYAANAVEEQAIEYVLEEHSYKTIIGVSMMASSYVGLAHLQQSFDIDIGEPFVGWELENIDELDNIVEP